jgi:hypothetical protein
MTEQDTERPMVAELRGRIAADARAYGGVLPREVVIAWEGYLAGLIEWGVITVTEHERLCNVLPPVDDSPVIHILLGREDADSSADENAAASVRPADRGTER